jgi:hypothetical protein
MKKNRIIYKLFLALGMSIVLLSCSDDEEDGASAGFAGIASSYYEEEGDGTIFVPFRDGSVSESDIEIDGTATPGAEGDYTITSFTDEGVTISLKDDDRAEKIETIRLTIPGTSGSANRTHTVRIVSDDPGILQVDLDWTGGSDLDLYLYRIDTVGGDPVFTRVAFSDPGGPILLDWTAPDATYALSYNYYAGTNNAQDFTVTFTPTGITLEGGSVPLVFQGTYTLANVDDENIQYEQFFDKKGTEFTNFTELDIPATGSRRAELVRMLRETVSVDRAALK